MSEQEKKLTIEEEFKTNLSGDLLNNALAFVEHMNKSSGWKHLDEGVCFTVTDPGNLYIYFGHHNGTVCFRSNDCTSDFDNYPISDELKEFVFAHINQCNHFRTNGKECGCGQQPGHSFTILGRKFDNLCNCPICFMNPDAETFEKVKELVEAWKLCIAELSLKKHNLRDRQ